MHLIISSGFGDIRAYYATIANAKEILSWQTVPADVVGFATNRPDHYTTYDVIASVVKKLLKAEEGDVVFTSTRDSSRTIVATQEAKHELVMYCFANNIPVASAVEPYVIQSSFNIKELQCLSLFHDMTIVGEWLANVSNRYSTIINDRWKDNATDMRKVRYIIEFVNEFSHRDDRYDVIEVQPTC